MIAQGKDEWVQLFLTHGGTSESIQALVLADYEPHYNSLEEIIYRSWGFGAFKNLKYDTIIQLLQKTDIQKVVILFLLEITRLKRNRIPLSL
ncbi:hypothetical protein B1F79_03935 [Coxiella-like endosymbiont of Rhipicephalus sanguineus]|uniref:hypothetical protein n=1 Tax=Coxiella-like endosymbiont of Rhipicephalus sanguineus TaxID=1955402 RepID=UPI00203E74A4|nr:hypothetical protein [Coxiella-like endosymbiont of Rhipicephalus sanguineus]MBT8506650.1 hypothetical protein [Coxiella-like endosymbiont of Rhipicephalus sanguineus]